MRVKNFLIFIPFLTLPIFTISALRWVKVWEKTAGKGKMNRGLRGFTDKGEANPNIEISANALARRLDGREMIQTKPQPLEPFLERFPLSEYLVTPNALACSRPVVGVCFELRYSISSFPGFTGAFPIQPDAPWRCIAQRFGS